MPPTNSRVPTNGAITPGAGIPALAKNRMVPSMAPPSTFS
jgi:hypothetical protein